MGHIGKRSTLAGLLRQRIVGGIHLGLLKPGDRLPSARRLTGELGADPRVIVTAYRQLEREGLVELRPRSGPYVRQPTGDLHQILPQLSEWMVGVLVEGLARGIPAPEVPERIRRCLETLRLRTLCIECNADQLHSLCDELRHDYGLETIGKEIDDLRHAGRPPELRQADLLVTTSFHSNEVREIAEREGKPWIAIVLRSEVVAEMTRQLAQGPVYFVATDRRFAPKLRTIFSGVGVEQNVRPVILPEDDVAAIPADAPVVIMKSARALLQGTPLLQRAAPLPRVFAPESAHEILSFIVRANLSAMAAQLPDRTTSP